MARPTFEGRGRKSPQPAKDRPKTHTRELITPSSAAGHTLTYIQAHGACSTAFLSRNTILLDKSMNMATRVNFSLHVVETRLFNMAGNPTPCRTKIPHTANLEQPNYPQPSQFYPASSEWNTKGSVHMEYRRSAPYYGGVQCSAYRYHPGLVAWASSHQREGK
ncbi:conserved hypothetical protein [Coccidioides posadasii str. Silveira]|uniref:Uncharacterized protein n=1 Tax=Coccidioides posadasii (strain RMSCC 757 / Silveira) TaxID=443226 RepID=E9DCP4_COCPS|nr:conserved hypothetical protein [Coccidioides posadasii str. Silveira]